MPQSKDIFTNLLTVSAELLLHVKLRKDTKAIEEILITVPKTELFCQLYIDDEKKTFWINIYNAFYQKFASRNDAQGKSIFSKKEIHIAYTTFSLDAIEHGILRKFRWKKSFGYLPNPFASKLIKKLALNHIDYRIHFALNCGAKSCPPIAFYDLKTINKQLDEAMTSFLKSETTINQTHKTIYTSKLMYWYLADFGGLKGIKQILKTILQQDITSYTLKFNHYSWEAHIENYA